MAIGVQTPQTESDWLLEHRHRIRDEEYHRMAEAGVFRPDARFELINGVLVEKMTKNPPHTVATDLMTRVLQRVVPNGWFLSLRNPVRIPEIDSEPEPDGKIVRGDPRDSQGRGVVPGDLGLVIEVADRSDAYDRGVKWEIYARSSIPTDWLLNLKTRVLEVYTDPTGPMDPAFYRASRIHGPDDEVPLILDGQEVARFAVCDLLP